MFSDYPDILSVEETMEVLDIGRNTMYALLGSGKLKAFKIGIKWKIPKFAVEDYIRGRCS